MNRYMKYTAFALICALIVSVTGCEDPAPVSTTEADEMVYTNSYEYGDDAFDVKSVVRFETETTVELWLSSTEGLTSIGSVMENGNYGVISVNRTYLGSRDLFKKAGSYAGFNELRFDNGHNAKAYIDMSFSADTVSVAFKIEKLFADGESSDKMFSGNYKGTFTDHEQILNNQWSFNRIAKNITKGEVFINTDADYNTTTRFCFYDDAAFMHEAISVTIPEERLGEDIVNLDDVITLTYDGGKEFELSNSANIVKLLASLTEDNATFDADFVNGSDFLAANFSGKVELNESKPNHIACTVYEKVDGEWNKLTVRRTDIHKLFVNARSSSTSFHFGMSADATSGNSDYYPALFIETKFMDGNYHFESSAIGRFKYSDDHNTISEQPFGGNAAAKATMCIEQGKNSSYKIILRIKDLTISMYKKADIEVFFEGTTTN